MRPREGRFSFSSGHSEDFLASDSDCELVALVGFVLDFFVSWVIANSTPNSIGDCYWGLVDKQPERAAMVSWLCVKLLGIYF